MNQKPPSPIVLARKKREAAALKANLKRRKVQAMKVEKPDPLDLALVSPQINETD